MPAAGFDVQRPFRERISRENRILGEHVYPANPIGFNPTLTPAGMQLKERWGAMDLQQRFDQAFGVLSGGEIDISGRWDKTAIDMRLLDSLPSRMGRTQSVEILGRLRESDNDIFKLGIFRVDEVASVRDLPSTHEVMTFNAADLVEVPVFGVAPGLTSQSSKSTGITTRVGIRFQMEREFMREPEGLLTLISYLTVVHLAVERWLLACAWRAVLSACDQGDIVRGHLGYQFGLPMSRSSITHVLDHVMRVTGILAYKNGLASLINIVSTLFAERGLVCSALAVPAGTLRMVSNMAFEQSQFLPVRTLDKSDVNSILANNGKDFVNHMNQGVRVFESPLIPADGEFHDPTYFIRGMMTYATITERAAHSFNGVDYQSDDAVPSIMDWSQDAVSMLGGGKKAVLNMPIFDEDGNINSAGMDTFDALFTSGFASARQFPRAAIDAKDRLAKWFGKKGVTEMNFFLRRLREARDSGDLPAENWFVKFLNVHDAVAPDAGAPDAGGVDAAGSLDVDAFIDDHHSGRVPAGADEQAREVAREKAEIAQMLAEWRNDLPRMSRLSRGHSCVTDLPARALLALVMTAKGVDKDAVRRLRSYFDSRERVVPAVMTDVFDSAKTEIAALMKFLKESGNKTLRDCATVLTKAQQILDEKDGPTTDLDTVFFTRADVEQLIDANVPLPFGALCVRAEQWGACSAVAFANSGGSVGSITMCNPSSPSWMNDDAGIYTCAPTFRAATLLHATAHKNIIVVPGVLRKALINGGTNHVFNACDPEQLQALATDAEFDPGWMLLPLVPGEDVNVKYLPLAGQFPIEIEDRKPGTESKLMYSSAEMADIYRWTMGMYDPNRPFNAMVSTSTSAANFAVASRAHCFYSTSMPNGLRNCRGRYRPGACPGPPPYNGLRADFCGESCKPIEVPQGGIPLNSIAF